VTDFNSVQNAIQIHKPDEIYNLAAQSFVGSSFANPTLVTMANTVGAMNVFLAAALFSSTIRIYQASTSEMFGNAPEPQSETTPFNPRSPYGASKLHAHHQAHIMRETRGTYIACGILFNHESPRRGPDFVSRKIARFAARFAMGDFSRKLELGYLDSERDWGYAPEYVRVMPLMLQADTPTDYVIATGECHSVQQFVDAAFQCVGIESDDLVVVNRDLIRPNEVARLRGDASRARLELPWEPKTTFPELVQLMVEAESRSLATGERSL
jgi:GDPmannose 4,6-dehydratase